MWYQVHSDYLSFSGAACDEAAPFVYASAAAACAVDMKRRCARHASMSAGSYRTLPVRPGVLWNGGPSPRTRQFSSVAGVMPINGAAVLASMSSCILWPNIDHCGTAMASMGQSIAEEVDKRRTPIGSNRGEFNYPTGSGRTLSASIQKRALSIIDLTVRRSSGVLPTSSRVPATAV